jgi:hypothetical protein
MLEYVSKEFQRRGWIFKFQPSQCPISNVNDACVFPSLSKKVSGNQAKQFDGVRKILRGEAIWEAALEAYNAMPASTIARSFAGHTQICTAMIEHEGNVAAFTRGANSLHNGVRRTYVSTEDGVVILEAALRKDIDGKFLKYTAPTLDELGGAVAVKALPRDMLIALGNIVGLPVFGKDDVTSQVQVCLNDLVQSVEAKGWNEGRK